MEPLQNRKPLTGKELLAIAMEFQQAGNEFKWSKVDDFTLWSAVIRGDSTISVGFSNYAQLGLNNKHQIIDYILEYTKTSSKYHGQATDLKKKDFKSISTIIIKLSDYETIGKLRKLPFVRYIEPWGFSLESYMTDMTNGRIQSGIACSSFNIDNSSDAYNVLPGTNSAVSWHLTAHKVDAAWSYGAGSGITIGMIDTGIMGSQELLTQNGFDWDPTSPRTIELFNNVEDCTHGTTVAGMIAGPINTGLAITGVAYRANIKSYKAGKDVLLNLSQEKAALVQALDQFNDDPDVKVINISLGYYNYNSTVWDELVSAETNNKLIICAAGSAEIYPNWGTGIYPAKHSNTIAATGVKYDPINDPEGKNLQKFGLNFNGSYVDFCTYLERSSDGQKALGMHDDTYDRVSAIASSAASALVSGVAALVWEQDPSLPRNEVINILKNAASIYYPYKTRNSQYGWGVVNAERAVMLAKYGFLNTSIFGPSVVNSTGTKYWTASVNNAGGNIDYSWYWNGQLVGWHQTYSRVFNSIVSGSAQLKLIVTTSVGQKDESNKSITITTGKGGGKPIEQ